jgi:DNA-binding MarR family transcriptional regulator
MRNDDEPDRVELRRQQWTREMPSLDTRGMAVLGRARTITLRVRPQIEAVFARHGLDTGEFDVLSTLLRSGPPYQLRPTELFNSLMISSGGLTARLARLQKAGLIERPESTSDGRSLPVRLTAEGLARTRTAVEEDMRLEAELIAGLSDAEFTTLAALLRKLARALEEGEKDGKEAPGSGS